VFTDSTLAVLPPLGPSPAVVEARAALAAQSTLLRRAIGRLERARATVPGGVPDERWRGVAHAAYAASVSALDAQLDDAIVAVRLARHATDRALATLDARV
jgi:hypothetical protein